MGIKRFLQINFIFLATGVLLCLGSTPTFAANGLIRTSPQTGNYHTGDTIAIQVQAYGGGTAFNAAKATVVVSPSLHIQSVTLGNCGFAFVHTPTQNDLSFAGVILGGSSTNCVVYTATAQAINSGIGSITFINGSIKSYKGAQELLNTTGNAAFDITGSQVEVTPIISQSPKELPITTNNGIKLYTLLTTIDTPPNVPLSALKVILDPNLPTQREVLGTQVPFTNPIIFDRVPEGIHVIQVYSYNQLFAKQILSVGGPQRTLVFGISAQRQQSSWITYIVTAIIILVLLICGVIIMRKFLKKRTQTPQTTNPQLIQ